MPYAFLLLATAYIVAADVDVVKRDASLPDPAMGRRDAAGADDDNVLRKQLSGKQLTKRRQNRLLRAESQSTAAEEIETSQANVRFEDSFATERGNVKKEGIDAGTEAAHEQKMREVKEADLKKMVLIQESQADKQSARKQAVDLKQETKERDAAKIAEEGAELAATVHEEEQFKTEILAKVASAKQVAEEELKVVKDADAKQLLKIQTDDKEKAAEMEAADLKKLSGIEEADGKKSLLLQQSAQEAERQIQSKEADLKHVQVPTAAPTAASTAWLSEGGGVGTHYEMLYHTDCGGDAISTWSSGESSLYGQAGLSESMDFYQCKKTCWDRSECAGFFWKPSEQRCSYWRQGPLRPSSDSTGNCLVKRTTMCDWPTATEKVERSPKDHTLSCASGKHEIEEVCAALYQAPATTTSAGSETDGPPCYRCKWTSNRRRSCQPANSECLCKSSLQKTHYGSESV